MAKVKIVKNLKQSGYPENQGKNYHIAHEDADYHEKKRSPKQYHKVNKLEKNLTKNELLGKNTASGKIEVSSKVPKKLRGDVATHERVEHKDLVKLARKKSK